MTKKKQTILVLVVLVLASLVGACKVGGKPVQPGASPDLVGTKWTLTSMDGSSLIEDTKIALYFEETHLGGAMTCNGYGGGRDSGKYTATSDGTLTILQLAVTVQLCSSPKGIMEQEAAYIEALLNTATYRVIDDRLEIDDAAGETKLVFVRKEQATMNPADLVGTGWQLVSLDDDSLAEGSPFTLVFRDEHRLHGQAGCRGYVGGYDAGESDIHLYWLAMMGTEHCLGQGTLPEWEGVYTTALESIEDYRLAKGRLELITVRGEVLVFEPLPEEDDASLEGTSWTLLASVETREVEGLPGPQLMPVDPLSGTEITVTFEDGTASGSAGCNTCSAAYTVDGSFLSLATLAVTEMGCTAPAGAMEQEQRYLGALKDVTAYRIDGSQLWLETGDGRALVFHLSSRSR
jgi:heat shock protein HslJ